MAWHRVSLSVRVFERRSSVLVWVQGRPILIARVDGKLYAMDAVCAHVGCALLSSTEGYESVCPAHEAKYDIRTGALVAPPRIKPELPCEEEESKVPLRTYPVAERDGLLEVEL